MEESTVTHTNQTITEIRIGFDFGTSGIKSVVVLDNNIHHLVDFTSVKRNGQEDENPYVYCHSPKGKSLKQKLGEIAPEIPVEDYLKSDVCIEIKKQIKIALTGIENFVKDLRKKPFTLKNCTDSLEIHLGIATEDIDVENNKISKRLCEIMHKALLDMGCKDDNIEITPYSEIQATMAGYLVANNIEKVHDSQLYFMYDAGAGTLDTACFNLHSNNKDKPKISILKKSVEWLGANIETENKEEKIISQITEIIMEVKCKKDICRPCFQKDSYQIHKIPVFRFGGACKDYWDKYVTKVHKERFKYSFVSDFERTTKSFARPENVSLSYEIEQEDFIRFWVAYGLSLDESDLDRVEFDSEEASDMQRSTRARPESIGQEQM